MLLSHARQTLPSKSESNSDIHWIPHAHRLGMRWILVPRSPLSELPVTPQNFSGVEDRRYEFCGSPGTVPGVSPVTKERYVTHQPCDEARQDSIRFSHHRGLSACSYRPARKIEELLIQSRHPVRR